ncbi:MULTISPECIES: hypothetical protein [Microbacterium]|uniref:hypothetical protein n=1 Tax=Microbacterium TaxID=33882 RepID=UPI00344C37B5
MADDEYRPQINPVLWADIRPFVIATVNAVEPALPYERMILLTAVAHHVAWVRLRTGPVLDFSHVYSRSMVGASVGDMRPATPSTKGRRRSILLRVGEAVGAIPTSATLPHLSASTATTPYSLAERARLRTWVELQGSASIRASLRALLAIGFGAGLLTRELCEVRAVDVACGARAIRVLGDRARTVPVDADWRRELDLLAREAASMSDTLFRPGVGYTRNTVVDIVRRAQGSTVVTTQRMRASWIVDRLTEGLPMQQIVAAAGVKSLDAFVRYEQYLPAPVSPPFEVRGD